MLTTKEYYTVKENDYNGYSLKTISDNYKVYLNGTLKLKDKQYFVEDNVIYFNDNLEAGTQIVIEHNMEDNIKIVTKNPYAKSIYKIFNKDAKFKNNETYTFNINIKGKDYQTTFKTKYSPFYTTAKKIRMDTGDLLTLVEDDIINSIIYQNSKEVDEIIAKNELELGDTIPTYVRNYVRYKTDIDLCYAAYLSISGRYGKQKKELNDLVIESTVNLPDLEEMLKRFKDLLKRAEEELQGEVSYVEAFVKAGDTSYPVSSRGLF